MERYKVAIKPSAAREVEAVGQKRDRQSIVERIASLAENPYPAHCTKLSGSTNRYRVRVGNYRVLYEVDEDEHLVVVVKAGHRKDVYR